MAQNVDPYTRIAQIMREIMQQQERIIQVIEEIAPREGDIYIFNYL